MPIARFYLGKTLKNHRFQCPFLAFQKSAFGKRERQVMAETRPSHGIKINVSYPLFCLTQIIIGKNLDLSGYKMHLEMPWDGLNEPIIGRTINSQFRLFSHTKMLEFWTAFEP